LTKRFSAKEERRRIVAAVYDPARVTATQVAFENHVNYFHTRGGGLPAALAKGLAAYLNSSPVDIYFRQFSGHTQVNASDLRSLPYPTRSVLIVLGRRVGKCFPAQEELDRLVDEVLFRG
jgi:adenine-specific DNA-methyltransferase